MYNGLSVGAWVGQRRKWLGLTQQELAVAANWGLGTIQKMERGKYRPSKQLAHALAKALAVPEEDWPVFVAAARAVVPRSSTNRKEKQSIELRPPPPAPATNLPTPPTSFVGRQTEVEAIKATLGQEAVRLLSLTGPGGVGKTRLALQVAHGLRDSFRDGVWLVELAPIRDPAQVVAAIALILDVKEVAGQTLLASLQTYLRDKQLLLLLDNCEHLLAAAPALTILLASAPRLKILVTTRAVLHLSGEHEFPVPPMNLDSVFPDGVWFVDLAAFPAGQPVAATLVHGLGIREVPGQSVDANLKAYLRERQMLLVFENAEHVPDVGLQVAPYLVVAPGVRMVGIRQGHGMLNRYQASAAQNPPPSDQGLWLEKLAHNEAVALFVARARSANHAWAVTTETLLAAAAICARVDSLPLAIELAAARSKEFAPAVLLQRLGHRLTLLTGGARDLAPRQQTLRATIDWSYDLLDAQTRWLFMRCAVFVGGWTGDAAAAVTAGEPGRRVDATYDVLIDLANQSLIRQALGHDGVARFGMLETIREYAWEQLAASGKVASVRQRHAAYFLTLAEQAAPHLQGSPQYRYWLDQLDGEHDNLRAALTWALAQGEAEIAGRLGVALWRFWRIHGYLSEGSRWLEAIIRPVAGAARRLPTDRAESASRPWKTILAALLHGAGVLADLRGEEQAVRYYEDGLALYRELGDRAAIAILLNNLANSALEAGPDHYEQAKEWLEEALALLQEIGDQGRQGYPFSNLGYIALGQGDYEKAHVLFTKARQAHLAANNLEPAISDLNNLGTVAFRQGQRERAQEYYAQSLAEARAVPIKPVMAAAFRGLGWLAEQAGDYDQARHYFRASLRLFDELHAVKEIARGLENLAGLAAVQGQPARAARLFGAAEGICPTCAATRWDATRDDYDRHFARAAFDQATVAAARAAGQALSLERAVAEALSDEP